MPLKLEISFSVVKMWTYSCGCGYGA